MEGSNAAVKLGPGAAFAHKVHRDKVADMGKAVYSRRPVIMNFRDYSGHLHLLTMPGVGWPFERQLLAYRERLGLSTQFTCVECDCNVYQAALFNLAPLVPLKTVVKFENVLVEDLIARCNQDFTGAWLDFTGPLTLFKLQAIHRLWLRVNHSLVITFMSARYDYQMRRLLGAAGGWDKLLMRLLRVPPARCQTVVYPSPTTELDKHHVNKMVQVTLRRRQISSGSGAEA